MVKYLAVLFIALPLFTLAQIRFEPGYFVNNDDNKIQCFISNVEWINNPVGFKFKLEESDEAKVADISTVKEFGVGSLRYFRLQVKIDTSEQALRDLTQNRYPEWSEKTLFLKVLVDGKAKLYQYHNPRFERFFYSVDSLVVEQLVYKQFFLGELGEGLGTNYMYLQQLKNRVSCGAINENELKRVKYNEEDLTRHFVNFNGCHGQTINREPKKSMIYFTITPGIDHGQFELHDIFNLITSAKAEGYRLGLMTEMVLPFNRNKWSIIVEPTYQSFKSGVLVQYSSIEVPFGARHYFFLGKESSLFLNGFLVVDLPLKYEGRYYGIKFLGKNPSASLSAGIGFRWQRLSLEGRHYFTRSILDDYQNLFLVYSKTSAILGYRIK